jgi:hypothetical protein
MWGKVNFKVCTKIQGLSHPWQIAIGRSGAHLKEIEDGSGASGWKYYEYVWGTQVPNSFLLALVLSSSF